MRKSEATIIKRDDYRYRMASHYHRTYPDLKIFVGEMVLYSGTCYKLPFISGAGVLADNCYLREIEGGFELYHLNGYLQLFYREVHGICEVNNDWMPFVYTKKILEYLNS